MNRKSPWEVIVVGAGLAGLSAAIYLGRALRKTLVIDSGKSMARWEPEVQNYLGFPKGISGPELLRRGRSQAKRYQVQFIADEVMRARKRAPGFTLRGKKKTYHAKCVLLATGIFHIPPDLAGVRACLGHSMFFCKDCDGFRVRKKDVVVYGCNNEAADYALGMLPYSACVGIVTAGQPIKWDRKHSKWIAEYQIPVYQQPILCAHSRGCQIQFLQFADGSKVAVDALFTTRGDVYLNKLATELGAKVAAGEVVVDQCMRTSVRGLYAAGCVTPANCQMIIAAGQGAAAAQAINRYLYEDSLRTHTLRGVRAGQLLTERTTPRLTAARRQNSSKKKRGSRKTLRQLLPAHVSRSTTRLRKRV